MTLRTLALIPITAAIVAAEPVRLDLQSFEQPLTASGWRTYAWSRPQEGIPCTVVDEAGGKVARLGAVDAGAAGLVAKSFPVQAADAGWRITLRAKRSADYAGNTPWFFLAVNDKDGKFLPPAIDFAPAAKPGAAWGELVLEVPRAKLPAGAVSAAVNLATAAIKGQLPAGALFIDDVRIEALR